MIHDGFVKRVSRPVAAVLLLTGCFHYVPAQVTPLPAPQTEVRVTLAQPLDVSLGEVTLNDVTRIEGIVTESDGDTLGLVARWLHPQVGAKYDAKMGSYGIPVGGIQQLETWRLSGRTTAIVIGVSVAALAVVFGVAARSRSGGGIEPPPPDVTSIVAPR